MRAKRRIVILTALCLFLNYACQAENGNPVSSGSAVENNSVNDPLSAGNADSLNLTVITCPHCGFKKTEELPVDVCQIAYTCSNCATVLHPEKGDCCVYCSYGTHKCPSKQ